MNFMVHKSNIAWLSEDKPLIVQFAANNVEDFADAAEIVAP